MIHWMQHSLL